MKKLALVCILLAALAGYVFLQPGATSPDLATYMPSGALLYLEAPNFGGLLRDWNASQVKTDWLASADYEVFSRSNLFSKLDEVFGQYGQAAGFQPSLASLIEMAGNDSALALYDIHEVQFLYVTRMAESALISSPLWAVRPAFQERQAGGVTFYLRTDAASKRTVAFAFTKGYLILATRDDLVAQSLELLAGGGNPSIAADRWYHDAVAQSSSRGELRLVMNLDLLAQSVYFRSYWVQRNVSAVRPYWTGIADVRRAGDGIVETRAFVRTPGNTAAQNSPAVDALLALVPPEAGMYKISPVTDPSAVSNLIVSKIIGASPERFHDWREAPDAVSPDATAGSEGDLETHIDEQPLPADTGLSDAAAAARRIVEKGAPRAMLLVQSSVPTGAFIRTPAAIVLESAADWDRDSVRAALSTAAARLWTTSQLGARWTAATVGGHQFDRLDGLGTLLVASNGRLLLLSNDASLLAALLNRTTAPANATPLTYAAGVRLSRERANYDRIMTALDFTAGPGFVFVRGGDAGAPSFFSGNIASLSHVLSKVAEVRVTEEERNGATVQNVTYRIE